MTKEKNYTNLVLVVLLIIAAFLLGKMWDKSKITGTASNPAVTPTVKAKDPDAVLAKYAQQIGLNLDQFKTCLNSNKYAQVVEESVVLANEIAKTAWDVKVIDPKRERIKTRDQAGLGTPAFFINGRLIEGAYPFEEFKRVIDGFLAGKKPDQSVLAKDQWERLVQKAAANKGDPESKVILVELSDYQCPFCARHATQVAPQIEKDYGDKIRHVFFDLPLPADTQPFHKLARKMAMAARCAGEQGKYWELHDLIYAGQAEWSG
jgi:hypothetical protein